MRKSTMPDCGEYRVSRADRKRKFDDAVATISLLQDLFSKTFFLPEKMRVPLKCGIFDDVIASGFSAATPAELATALRVYCSCPHYLDCLRPGAARIDLDGNVAGVVSDEDAAHAAEKFTQLLQRAARRKNGHANAQSCPNGQKCAVESQSVPSGQSIQSDPPSKPARLSLKDLREAAAAGRQAAA
jgi:ProP effector